MQINIFDLFPDGKQTDDFTFSDVMQTQKLPPPVVVNETYPKPLQIFALVPCKGCGMTGCRAEFDVDEFGNRYLAKYTHLKTKRL